MKSFDKDIALGITLNAAREYAGQLLELRRREFDELQKTRRRIGKVLLMVDENAAMKRLEPISVQGDTKIEDLELDSLGDEGLITEIIKEFVANEIPYNERELARAVRGGIADSNATLGAFATHLVNNRQRITTIDTKAKK